MMDQTMEKLLSLSIISLLLISFQSFAGRPAEDDPALAMEPIAEETQPNILTSESTMQETVTDELSADTMTNESQQTGDILQLNESPTKPHIIIIDFPVRGMDMSKVLNELGEPITRSPAIGKPPITRWIYSDRIVFFEYSYVIHVVAK
jgi:hypothetical protein